FWSIRAPRKEKRVSVADHVAFDEAFESARVQPPFFQRQRLTIACGRLRVVKQIDDERSFLHERKRNFRSKEVKAARQSGRGSSPVGRIGREDDLMVPGGHDLTNRAV